MGHERWARSSPSLQNSNEIPANIVKPFLQQARKLGCVFIVQSGTIPTAFLIFTVLNDKQKAPMIIGNVSWKPNPCQIAKDALAPKLADHLCCLDVGPC